MSNATDLVWRNAGIVAALTVAWVVALTANAAIAATQLAAEPETLAKAMTSKRIVLLGEVHDNPGQHVLRAAALRKLAEQGARPAIAFEQFDREQQVAIDQARKDRPRDAGYVIAQGKGAPSWRWEFYRPFVELALEYELPIVAANLSREAAMKLALAAPGKDERAVNTPAMTPAFLAAHEQSIARGHCDLLPPEALPGMARAQIARDRALAESIRPYAERGVVLLTGNGHARIDLGVPFWLTADERANAISIGLLERDTDDNDESPDSFDAYLFTAPAERADPCDELRRQKSGIRNQKTEMAAFTGGGASSAARHR